MQEFKNIIFPAGERASASYFTGNVWVTPLVPREPHNHYSIADVKFEAGGRMHWHTHPAGQVLLVTDGHGFYQEKGKPARRLQRGDVVEIPADVEHWHGAAADNQLIHVAISNFREQNNVTWLQPVTEEEYNGTLQSEQ